MMVIKIYIDASNLKFGIEQSGWKLDYKRFFNWLKNKFGTENMILFIGFISDNQDIYKKLNSYGYQLNFRPTLLGKDGKIKGNVDGELILAVLIDYFENNLDQAIIISGDGDYYCVVEFLKNRNIPVTIIAPNKNYLSLLLKRANVPIIILNELRPKLSIK